METDLKRGFFEKDGKQIKYTKDGRAKQEFHSKQEESFGMKVIQRQSKTKNR